MALSQYPDTEGVLQLEGTPEDRLRKFCESARTYLLVENARLSAERAQLGANPESAQVVAHNEGVQNYMAVLAKCRAIEAAMKSRDPQRMQVVEGDVQGIAQLWKPKAEPTPVPRAPAQPSVSEQVQTTLAQTTERKNVPEDAEELRRVEALQAGISAAYLESLTLPSAGLQEPDKYIVDLRRLLTERGLQVLVLPVDAGDYMFIEDLNPSSEVQWYITHFPGSALTPIAFYTRFRDEKVSDSETRTDRVEVVKPARVLRSVGFVPYKDRFVDLERFEKGVVRPRTKYPSAPAASSGAKAPVRTDRAPWDPLPTSAPDAQPQRLNKFGLPHGWALERSLQGLEELRQTFLPNEFESKLKEIFARINEEYKRYKVTKLPGQFDKFADALSGERDHLAKAPDEKLKYFNTRFPNGLTILGTGKSIKWEKILPYELWAIRNHLQTFASIQRRGGMSPKEIVAMMFGLDVSSFQDTSNANCMQWFGDAGVL